VHRHPGEAVVEGREVRGRDLLRGSARARPGGASRGRSCPPAPARGRRPATPRPSAQTNRPRHQVGIPSSPAVSRGSSVGQATNVIADTAIDLVGTIGRQVLANLMPARRLRVSPRIVKRAISKYQARGPNIVGINIHSGEPPGRPRQRRAVVDGDGSAPDCLTPMLAMKMAQRDDHRPCPASHPCRVLTQTRGVGARPFKDPMAWRAGSRNQQHHRSHDRDQGHQHDHAECLIFTSHRPSGHVE